MIDSPLWGNVVDGRCVKKTDDEDIGKVKRGQALVWYFYFCCVTCCNAEVGVVRKFWTKAQAYKFIPSVGARLISDRVPLTLQPPISVLGKVT